MRSITATIGMSVLAYCVAPANAATGVDRSFSASGRDCSSIRWSDAALEKYPKIASACREVIERGGKRYVRLEGTLAQNIDNGRQWRVNFQAAGVMTLTPPPGLQVYVDGRPVSPAEVQRGAALTFYVAEDRLAAQFYSRGASPVTTTEHVVVPILYAEGSPASAANRPGGRRTLPNVLMLGLLLITFVIMLNLRRIVRRF